MKVYPDAETAVLHSKTAAIVLPMQGYVIIIAPHRPYRGPAGVTSAVMDRHTSRRLARQHIPGAILARPAEDTITGPLIRVWTYLPPTTRTDR